MGSQYDAIGSKYGVFKEMWTSTMEEENLKAAVLPYLSKTTKPRVLDLASGTGFYSKKLVDWGADYVLGVDLSNGMVNAARELLSKEGKYAGKVKFEVGNALDLGKVQDEEPFDVVLGAWMLNYASDLHEMTQMFQSIAANLKEGGVFVGLTPSPAQDVDILAKEWSETQAKLPHDFPVQINYYERLSSGEGWKTEIANTAGGERVSFRNFHLKQSVYEESARGAGMVGKLVWPKVLMPEQPEAKAALASGAWMTFVEGGKNMGIIIVEK